MTVVLPQNDRFNELVVDIYLLEAELWQPLVDHDLIGKKGIGRQRIDGHDVDVHTFVDTSHSNKKGERQVTCWADLTRTGVRGVFDAVFDRLPRITIDRSVRDASQLTQPSVGLVCVKRALYGLGGCASGHELEFRPFANCPSVVEVICKTNFIDKYNNRLNVVELDVIECELCRLRDELDIVAGALSSRYHPRY